jgi:hypothetical protein
MKQQRIPSCRVHRPSSLPVLLLNMESNQSVLMDNPLFCLLKILGALGSTPDLKPKKLTCLCVQIWPRYQTVVIIASDMALLTLPFSRTRTHFFTEMANSWRSPTNRLSFSSIPAFLSAPTGLPINSFSLTLFPPHQK